VIAGMINPNKGASADSGEVQEARKLGLGAEKEKNRTGTFAGTFNNKLSYVNRGRCLERVQRGGFEKNFLLQEGGGDARKDCKEKIIITH